MNVNEHPTVISKGGYNGKAWYETTHARIPVELKELVQALSNEYKLTGKVPSLEPIPVFQLTLTKEEAIALANQLVKSKKGAKHCLEKLLTTLYSPPVILD